MLEGDGFIGVGDKAAEEGLGGVSELCEVVLGFLGVVFGARFTEAFAEFVAAVVVFAVVRSNIDVGGCGLEYPAGWVDDGFFLLYPAVVGECSATEVGLGVDGSEPHAVA